MGAELIIVRHGQVGAEWRERIYGCLDVPLSDEGRAQARRAARHLASQRLDLVASSGLARTRYGAAVICEGRGLEQVVDPDLREIERGAWAGLTFAELERRQPGAMAHWREHAWESRPEAGESMSDLSERVLPALDRLVRRCPGGVIAAVAHSHVARCAVAHALGRDAAARQQLPTGVVLRFAWRAGGPAQLLSSETFGDTE
jgi:probable phosphoglycerate mutase